MSYTPRIGRECLGFAMGHAEAVIVCGPYIQYDCRGHGAYPKLTHCTVHIASMLVIGPVNRALSLCGRQRTNHIADG
jgi:hypothetical protein